MKKKIIIIKKGKVKSNSEKSMVRIEQDIKINRSFNPKDIPRYLISFPSHYHFMSNFNVNTKKRKK